MIKLIEILLIGINLTAIISLIILTIKLIIEDKEKEENTINFSSWKSPGKIVRTGKYFYIVNNDD